jgi:16S rRNA (cytidine1402-2'-O)-methyltransferase
LQAVEREFGRVRTVPNGPRTLDVDIIDFEGVVSTSPELLLPHPRALERDFVVTPLLAVAPGYVLADGTPVTRESIAYGRVLGVVDEAAGGDGRIAVAPGGQVEDEPGGRTAVAPGQQVAVAPGGHTEGALDKQIEGEPDGRAKGEPGILSLCATPIGNLGDLTLRVIETLEAADLVLAEDTRVARRLLSHLGIRASVERCDENTIRQRSARVVERVAQGWRVAYVSDAGTPTVADPGSHLVAAVRQAGLPVEVLPGPSAVLTALVASGLTGQAFYFGGFLPRRHARIIATLEALAALDATLVFFESPRRAAAALAAIAEVFPEREVVLARELTKLHEEVLCDNAPALAQRITAREQGGRPLKGEVVIVIAAPTRPGTRRIHRDKYKDG